VRQSDEVQRALFGEFAELIPVRQDLGGTELGLSQALFTWGQVGAAIRGARYALATATDRERIARQGIRREVTAAFYDVLLAREMAVIARQTLEQRQRHLEEARHRHQAGTATDYDVLAAEVALANARPEAIRAENAIATARAVLKLHLAVDREVDVVGELTVGEVVTPEFEASLARALEMRPELADAAHRRMMQREIVTIAKAQDKPRLDLSAGYGWRRIEAGAAAADGGAWRAGVYLSFPFFDGFKTAGQVAQARSDLASVEIEEAQLADRIALEVRTAVNALQEAAAILEGTRGTVEQAERLLWMAEQAFEHGVMRRLDVEDAQVNRSAARANLARARRDYAVALATLRWAEGEL
jgi:hydrophobic/amphiphilic exporter-1 (mainly G- bacteria), HAE1 family